MLFDTGESDYPFDFDIVPTPSGDRSDHASAESDPRGLGNDPGPIYSLWGGLDALKSGFSESGESRNLRQVAGNLSQITLRVLGYLAVLLALQYWIGLRPQLGW